MNGTKTKRSGIGLLALAVAGALAVALAAAAQPGPPAGAGKGGPFLRALRGGLATVGVTDDQKVKIRAILEAKKDDAEALGAKTRVDGVALKSLANAAAPDPTAVGKAFLTLKGDREAAREMAEGVLADVKAVLTPEQAGKLDAYLAALKQMRGGRKGRG
jgi:Spy/CpxP family protein refolding chaperone